MSHECLVFLDRFCILQNLCTLCVCHFSRRSIITSIGYAKRASPNMQWLSIVTSNLLQVNYHKLLTETSFNSFSRARFSYPHTETALQVQNQAREPYLSDDQLFSNIWNHNTTKLNYFNRKDSRKNWHLNFLQALYHYERVRQYSYF